jgi:hypothetical protein
VIQKEAPVHVQAQPVSITFWIVEALGECGKIFAHLLLEFRVPLRIALELVSAPLRGVAKNFDFLMGKI